MNTNMKKLVEDCLSFVNLKTIPKSVSWFRELLALDMIAAFPDDLERDAETGHLVLDTIEQSAAAPQPDPFTPPTLTPPGGKTPDEIHRHQTFVAAPNAAEGDTKPDRGSREPVGPKATGDGKAASDICDACKHGPYQLHNGYCSMGCHRDHHDFKQEDD